MHEVRAPLLFFKTKSYRATKLEINKKASDLGRRFRNLPDGEITRLINVGRIAAALFVNSGMSEIPGPLTPKQREKARNKERNLKWFREEHGDAGPEMLEALEEAREERVDRRRQRQEEKRARKQAILDIRESPVAAQLFSLCPDLLDVSRSLVLTSTNPPVFSFYPFKDAAESGAVIPEQLWQELRENAEETVDKRHDFDKRHLLAKDRF